MTLITVFSTLRLRTLCTFSHEPPHIVTSLVTIPTNANAMRRWLTGRSNSTSRGVATCASLDDTRKLSATAFASALTAKGPVATIAASAQRSLVGQVLPLFQSLQSRITSRRHLNRQPAPSRLTSPQDRRKSVCKLPRCRWRTLGNNSRR